MNSNKDIQNHLDQLLNAAIKPAKVSTSSNFEQQLFSRLDDIELKEKKNVARIFTLSEIRKYAAVILILILNISAVVFYTTKSTEEQSVEDVSKYSDEYFPDYATLTSLE